MSEEHNTPDEYETPLGRMSQHVIRPDDITRAEAKRNGNELAEEWTTHSVRFTSPVKEGDTIDVEIPWTVRGQQVFKCVAFKVDEHGVLDPYAYETACEDCDELTQRAIEESYKQ